MSNFTLNLLQFFILVSLFIFIFLYSITSTEPTTVFVSLIIFLILYIPFLQILNEIELFMYNINIDNLLFKTIISYSKFFIIFIGIFLIAELFYVSFFG